MPEKIHVICAPDHPNTPNLLAELRKQDHYNFFVYVDDIESAETVWYPVPDAYNAELERQLGKALELKRPVVLSGEHVGRAHTHAEAELRFKEHRDAITWLTCTDAMLSGRIKELGNYLGTAC